jgi:hypothetical protein
MGRLRIYLAVLICVHLRSSAVSHSAVAPTPVLDIQKLRIVTPATHPSRVLTCDVLVVGGGLGGVAATEALLGQGRSVVLAEPTSWLGGQLTSQGVAVPDEHSSIERTPGIGTRRYRELREQVRATYAAMPGIKPGRAQNVGQCWVSRVSGEPAIWEACIRQRLGLKAAPGVKAAPGSWLLALGLKGPGQEPGAGSQEPRAQRAPPGARSQEPGARSASEASILLRHQIVRVRRFPHSGEAHYADLVDLDTGQLTRVAARYLLDATETGDVLPLAGLPWTVGAEGRDATGEPHAPPEPRPDWIQSFTYCFAVRWQPEGPHQIVPRPPGYDYFKSLGEYTLAYDYSDARGRVYYKVFQTARGAGGPFWTYRRLVAASSFEGNPRYATDLVLINWRGNDFHDENPLGSFRWGVANGVPSVGQQRRVLWRARWFAQGFLHWLQTECPRDDGGFGYPEMQLATDAFASGDGFALFPYIRESRRILAEFTLTEQHLTTPGMIGDRLPSIGSAATTAERFFDTVGIAFYAMDIHPARGEPPLLQLPLPYYLPLGSLLPRSGPANVLPAAKNFGATRLALSSARMHPTEWLVGEVAGHLAAFCLERGVRPPQVRNTPDLLAAFQDRLREGGVPLSW